jgi:hypothetical protein
MDLNTALVIAIIVLSAVLVVVGIYAILVLRNLLEATSKLKKILGRVDSISEHVDTNIIRPATSLAGILAILRDGAKIASEVKHLSSDTAETAHLISSEAKEVSEAVKEELVPAVTEGAKEVITEVKEDAKDVAEVAKASAEEVIAEVKKPEPMKSGSLKSSRRFFSKRR